MKNVLRWGQSAYETDADLDLERIAAESLGAGWRVAPDPMEQPNLSGVDVLVVTSKVRVDAAVLDAFPGTHVLTTTSGFDHIDVDAATERDIAVGRCPLARRDAVVEAALGAMLALGKRWPDQLAAAQSGRWARADLPRWAPLGLRGSTVLVVGLGVIGTQMAHVLNALDAHVLGVDPCGVPDGVEGVTLEEGLSRADVLTLHLSLGPTSRGLIGVRELDLLPRGAVVVNTARGGSLDVPATVERVRTGHLAGAAIDVFPVEPHPELARHAAVPGVWLFPHAAGYAPDLGTRVSGEVAAALEAVAEGRALPHAVGGRQL